MQVHDPVEPAVEPEPETGLDAFHAQAPACPLLSPRSYPAPIPARVCDDPRNSVELRERVAAAAQQTLEPLGADEMAHASITDTASALVSQIASETGRLEAARLRLAEERAAFELEKQHLLGFRRGGILRTVSIVGDSVDGDTIDDIQVAAEATRSSDEQSSTSVLEGVPGIIELNVGGVLYTTYLDTLRNAPADSLLGKMFCEDSGWTFPRDSAGRVLIDRDGLTFVHVLNFLRDGTMPPDDNDDIRGALLGEARWFGLQTLVEWCESTWTRHLGRLQVCDHYVAKAAGRFTFSYALNRTQYDHFSKNEETRRDLGPCALSICGCVYDPTRSTEEDCLHHPGQLGYKYMIADDYRMIVASVPVWTCCNVVSAQDIKKLLRGNPIRGVHEGLTTVDCPIGEVPGCQRGRHGLRESEPPLGVGGNREGWQAQCQYSKEWERAFRVETVVDRSRGEQE
eukprot:COSAG02_NODE_3795_length_6217_cov_4.382151_2_plen_456_part_00